MQLDVDPPLDARELAALRTALAGGSGSGLDELPDAYASPWRRAAVREAVENEPARRRYTRSPRSTRGATRA